MIYLAVVTSIFASIFLTISMKVLSLFHFVKWSPVGYTKRLGILENSHWSIKWLFLLIIVFLITLIFYLIMQYIILVPHFLTSLVIGALLALIIEWFIFELPAELSSFKKLSIPFMVTVIVTARFVFETAAYHYRAHAERNKLPYKDTVIK
ncbi:MULTISPECIES: hypothetical protein [Lysinibacillus]|uniref:Uncharacterized protein n=1 Tax=Lysinibacillus antri TaxID=2498145 RepID=A0A3S0QS48_9BACI|nr:MULTISPECIES: hypothetical protein [Lysinibacillus]RUL56944.1 hypothetical protein EK386_00545 [Lysinibacillus antri]TSI08567.1 hypothetical protein FJQ64_06325 [Lysinibacillus sp. BW-2-10]